MSGESPRKSATWTRGGPESIEGETLSASSGSFKTVVEGGDETLTANVERFYYCPQTFGVRSNVPECNLVTANGYGIVIPTRVHANSEFQDSQQSRFLKVNVASTTFSIPNVSLYNSRIKVFIMNKSIDFARAESGSWRSESGRQVKQ